ncbi:MAG: hypothetical protein ACRC6R_08785 [Bacteroidales bacterium]
MITKFRKSARALLGIALLCGSVTISAQDLSYEKHKNSTYSSFSRDSIKVNKEKRDRNNMNNLRFRKGDKFVGANLSFGGKEAENDFLMANIDLPDVEKRALSASFVMGYFLNPRTSVGVRGRYNYSKGDQTLVADFLGVAFNADEYRTQNLTSGFELHAFARNYVALGSSRNFYLFNESSVYYGYKGSYSRAISDPGKPNERIRKIRSDNYTVGIGLSPGITYFTSPRTAIEFQLGTSGFEYTKKKHLTDDKTKGESDAFSFRDGLSFLRIQFGFSYYFN